MDMDNKNIINLKIKKETSNKWIPLLPWQTPILILFFHSL